MALSLSLYTTNVEGFVFGFFPFCQKYPWKEMVTSLTAGRKVSLKFKASLQDFYSLNPAIWVLRFLDFSFPVWWNITRFLFTQSVIWVVPFLSFLWNVKGFWVSLVTQQRKAFSFFAQSLLSISNAKISNFKSKNFKEKTVEKVIKLLLSNTDISVTSTLCFCFGGSKINFF